MDDRQKKRLTNVAFLALAALGLIGLISVFSERGGGAAQPGAGDGAGAPPALTQRRPMRPGQLPIGATQDGRVERADPRTGRLAQAFKWKRLDPEADFLFNVTQPEAEVHLSPNRVIRMRADAGQIVAPNNYPQSGEFRDHVVITMYECEPGRAVDLSPGSKDTTLVMHLDGVARFDTTLGTIESADPLHVTTKQVDFTGRGLKLTYNQVARRIDYLEIAHGDQLRFHPELKSKGASEQPAPAAPVAQAAPVAPSESAEPEPPDIQHYQVVFNDDVKVRSEGRGVDARRMIAFFAFDRGLPDADADSAAEKQTRGPRDQTTESAKQPTTEGAERAATDGPLVNARSMMRQTDQDVVITWSGPMVMTPLDDKPASLGADGDVYVLFSGQTPGVATVLPVRIVGDKGEVVECRQVEYFDHAKLIRAERAEQFPLTIRSPQLGTAVSDRLEVNLDQRIASLIGAGSIRSATADAASQPAAPDAPADAAAKSKLSQGLPPGMRIHWTDRVDLHYAEASAKHAGVEKAQFRGQVRINDLRFAMAAERLDADFAASATDADTRQLSAMNAEGDVEVKVEQGLVRAQRLRVETEAGKDGRLVPRRIIAEQRVFVRDRQQQLWTNNLVADLMDAPPAPPKTADGKPADTHSAVAAPGDAPPPSVADQFTRQIRSVTATDDVRLLIDRDTLVLGDRLDADAVAKTARVFGSPVRILKSADFADADNLGALSAAELRGLSGETDLRVVELFMQEDGRLAKADGPGEFHFLDAPSVPKPDAAKPDAPAIAANATPDDPRQVDVVWFKEMTYDDKANRVHVMGKVHAATIETPTEVNELDADDLVIEMVDPNVLASKPAEGVAAVATSPPPPADDWLTRRRMLRKLVAQRNVVLLSTRWTAADRKQIETRLRIAGPNLSFEDARQYAEVNGPGTMVLEDYREPSKSIDAQSAPPPGFVPAMTSRGASLFEWKTKMSLDGANQQLILDGGVSMTHQPFGGKELIRLTADRLVTMLRQDAPLGAFKGSRVESWAIRSVEASGGVEIKDGKRLINAMRLLYDAEKQIIMLQGFPDRPVEVVQLDKPKPLKADAILWDLKTDRIDVFEGKF